MVGRGDVYAGHVGPGWEVGQVESEMDDSAGEYASRERKGRRPFHSFGGTVRVRRRCFEDLTDCVNLVDSHKSSKVLSNTAFRLSQSPRAKNERYP